MKRANKVVIMITVFLVTGFFGCDSGPAPERNEAVKAVRDYNSMIQMAYLQANLNLMPDFATEKQIRMLFPTIQALQIARSSMRTEQTAFKVRRVSVTGDQAVVTTKETWVYWWQSVDTGDITKPKETLTYNIKFHLVKEKGKWKVDSLEEN